MTALVQNLHVELSSALISVSGFTAPQILVLQQDKKPDSLPSGAFDPYQHKTLEYGARAWISQQTPFIVDYIEQLYTFSNKSRISDQDAQRVISVGYLALTQETIAPLPLPTIWKDWYRYFPWEDWREGRPKILDNHLIPALLNWANSTQETVLRTKRNQRLALNFALEKDMVWNNEAIQSRYELLYEAHLIPEYFNDQPASAYTKEAFSRCARTEEALPMQYDHRRILATAIGRLRGKLKYQPIIFDLMPETFTLLQLQQTVEALNGHRLHKQNFRRLLEKNRLIESTGRKLSLASGRPANLFRFRTEALTERTAHGVTLSPPK